MKLKCPLSLWLRAAPGRQGTRALGNPHTGEVQAVPRHIEISNNLAKTICRGLSIPKPPG